MPIPRIKIGKTYKFYDDGKIRLSRQYNAGILDVTNRLTETMEQNYDLDTIFNSLPDYDKSEFILDNFREFLKREDVIKYLWEIFYEKQKEYTISYLKDYESKKFKDR